MKKRDLYMVYVFGGIAILGGLKIIIVGEIGRAIGESLYRFEGLERLYGLYPIAIGSLAIWLFRWKYKEEKEE